MYSERFKIAASNEYEKHAIDVCGVMDKEFSRDEQISICRRLKTETLEYFHNTTGDHEGDFNDCFKAAVESELTRRIVEEELLGVR